MQFNCSYPSCWPLLLWASCSWFVVQTPSRVLDSIYSMVCSLAISHGSITFEVISWTVGALWRGLIGHALCCLCWLIQLHASLPGWSSPRCYCHKQLQFLSSCRYICPCQSLFSYFAYMRFLVNLAAMSCIPICLSNGENSILWLCCWQCIAGMILLWLENIFVGRVWESCCHADFQSSQLAVYVIQNNVAWLSAISHIHSRPGFIVEFTLFLIFLYKEGYATKHALKLTMTPFL